MSSGVGASFSLTALDRALQAVNDANILVELASQAREDVASVSSAASSAADSKERAEAASSSASGFLALTREKATEVAALRLLAASDARVAKDARLGAESAADLASRDATAAATSLATLLDQIFLLIGGADSSHNTLGKLAALIESNRSRLDSVLTPVVPEGQAVTVSAGKVLISGPGSTGDVSAMSVSPAGSAAPNSLARIVADLVSALGASAPIASPTFTGSVTTPSVALTGLGSTGDVSGMSVTPSGAGQAGSLAKRIADLLVSIGSKAPIDNPAFTGTAAMSAVNITGSGSAGDVSGMSVTPSVAGLAGTLAKIIADLSAALGAKAPSANPTFTGTVTTPAVAITGPGSTGDASGMIIRPAAGTPTTDILLRDLTGYISPVSWGFDPANTAALNTTALNKAIGQAAATGKPVCIKHPGTYPFGHLTITKAGVRIVSDPGVVFRLADGTNAPLFTLQAANITIDGGVFDGNAAGNPTVDYNGLIQAGGDGATIRRVTVRNWNGLGIQSYVNNVTIEDNYITGTKQSAVFSTDGSGPTRGLAIRRNRIEHLTYTPGSPADMCIQVHANNYDLSGIAVSDNTCDMIQTTAQNPIPFTVMGIELLGASPTIRVRDYSITDNIVHWGGQGISVGNTTNGVISGGALSGFSQYGLEIAGNNINVRATAPVDGTGAAGNSVWVSANNTNVTVGPATIIGGADAAVYAYNTQVSFVGLTIVHSGNSSGIYCQSCRDAIVANNTVVCTANQGYPIQIAGGYNVSVAGNISKGSSLASILFWDGGEAGPFLFRADGNTLLPASGQPITRNFGSKTTTGSILRNNTTPTGVVADWTSP